MPQTGSAMKKLQHRQMKFRNDPDVHLIHLTFKGLLFSVTDLKSLQLFFLTLQCQKKKMLV